MEESEQRVRKRKVGVARPNERTQDHRMGYNRRGVMWGGYRKRMPLHRLPVHACEMETGG